MNLKLILVAVGAVVISVAVFKKSNSTVSIVGFCGVYTMLLLAVNEILSMLH